MNKNEIEIKLREEFEIFKKEILKKYTKKEYQIGDIVVYKGLEWFVTEIYEDGSIKLMLADKLPNEIIEQVFDDEEMRDRDNDIRFDKESYDWQYSYIRERLNGKFIEVLGIDPNDLSEMFTNYAEEECTTDLVRIPSIKECEELPKEVIKRDSIWSFYLINKGVYRADIDEYNHGLGAGVFAFNSTDGSANVNGSFRVVRPVITVKSDALK